jgi:flavin-dependent dehydrogenase
MAGTSPDFDVIVAGGGPAGVAAAIECRRRDLRTLLLEASASPRNRPGETLHPGAESLFRALGVSDAVNGAGFPRHGGIAVRRGNAVSIQRYGADDDGEWLGYQAHRAELDRILLEQAAARGAIIRRGERANRPIVTEGVVRGVKTGSGEFRAAFVVDAGGPAHWLARRLGLRLSCISPRLLAKYGWAEMPGSPAKAGGLPEFRWETGGWSWNAPVSSNRLAWVRLSLAGEEPRKPRSRTNASDVTWRIVRPNAGPGYFLAGDAACVLDPAASHGVLRAIMSGMLAAQAAARILEQPASAERIAEGYSRWMEQAFCRDAEALISLYSGLAPSPLWLGPALEAVRNILRNPSA